LTLKRKQEQAAAAESGAPASKQKKVIIQVSRYLWSIYYMVSV